jgi:hypothetical protein
MCEEPEISEKKLIFDPFSLEPDYRSYILSQKKQNLRNRSFGNIEINKRQYSTTSLRAKDAAAICASENAPAEFYAAKDRGEVTPGIPFNVWWREQ